jgi:hypothetical protein
MHEQAQQTLAPGEIEETKEAPPVVGHGSTMTPPVLPHVSDNGGFGFSGVAIVALVAAAIWYLVRRTR